MGLWLQQMPANIQLGVELFPILDMFTDIFHFVLLITEVLQDLLVILHDVVRNNFVPVSESKHINLQFGFLVAN